MESVIDKLDHLIGYGEWSGNEFVRIVATQAKQELIKNINVKYDELWFTF